MDPKMHLGSHPCLLFSISYGSLRDFNGDNTTHYFAFRRSSMRSAGARPLFLGLLFQVDQGSNSRSTHGFRASLPIVRKAAIVPQAVAESSRPGQDIFSSPYSLS